jgi:3-dehydroquinate synthase
MNVVHLDLGQNAYDILVGQGLLTDGQRLREHVRGRQVFIVSNPAVAEHYLPVIESAFEGFEVDHHLIPDGEEFKTLATLNDLVGALLEKGHNRGTTIVALGGGVVGDTAGFAAASYQRGVDFIQVPTTLLSQVDSSVGGKTAVNHAAGKNMIGAFYQPKAVYIDTNTLLTLPARELSAGLAEVIKHGVLADAEYFNEVEAGIEKLRSLDAGVLAEIITGSCRIKAGVVAEDERESGRRALLNFGHTFGHAIETAMGYGEWLHGEAVGAGMVLAARLSFRLGRCSDLDVQRIRNLIEKAGLPVEPPDSIDADRFLELMARDKKANDDGLRFVLLDGGIGRTALVSDVPTNLVREVLSG